MKGFTVVVTAAGRVHDSARYRGAYVSFCVPLLQAARSYLMNRIMRCGLCAAVVLVLLITPFVFFTAKQSLHRLLRTSADLLPENLCEQYRHYNTFMFRNSAWQLTIPYLATTTGRS